MKWINHRSITTSIATIGCYALHGTLSIPDLIFVYGAYVGSTLPDQQEYNNGNLSFKNHRQRTHYLLPYMIGLLVAGTLLYLSQGLTFEGFRIGATVATSAATGVLFGTILHILEDALTGTVPHPIWPRTKKRMGKKILPEPYEYLLSAIFVTIAGICFMKAGFTEIMKL